MSEAPSHLRGADVGIWCFGYLEGAVDQLLAVLAGQDMPPLVAREIESLQLARQRAAAVWEGRSS